MLLDWEHDKTITFEGRKTISEIKINSDRLWHTIKEDLPHEWILNIGLLFKNNLKNNNISNGLLLVWYFS